MGKATEGVSYIDGSTSDNTNNAHYVGDGEIQFGNIDNSGYINKAVVDAVKGIDVNLGNVVVNNVHQVDADDRAPNLPSGYNAKGVPTYGDGKQNLTYNFPEDYTNNVNEASIAYKADRAPVQKKFSDLST